MAMNVTISQRIFGNKSMPLEVILGSELHYGRLESDHLEVEERDENEIIVYDPGCIGRGFSVEWNPDEKKKLKLRLPMPAPEKEIRQFYSAVARMTEYWKAKLNVDDEATTLSAFMQGLEEMIRFNEKLVRNFAQEVLDGKHEKLMLWSAMWPLEFGGDEAQRFLETTAAFGEWLHEKQSMDVYHAPVQMYRGESGPMGLFFCMDECPTVYPDQPTVPFGLIDENTGKPLVCNDWRVALMLQNEEDAIGQIAFNDFVKKLDSKRISRYDAGHFLMQPLTESEMRALLEA